MSDLLYSNYIGPKAENIETLRRLVNKIIDHQKVWRNSFFQDDVSLYPNQQLQNEKLEEELNNFLNRYNKNTPFFHPRYSAQMLKDTTIPTIIGYLAFMMTNPNNHAYEGGPVTTEMEMEVTEMLMKMIGYKNGWGHLTSGGSLANTEALWAIRDYYKTGSVYFSEVSHYSWKRICNILRIPDYKEIEVDKNFRMDLNKLEEALKQNNALVVIANFGSTGTGSVDDISGILSLKEKYNFHLHVDAAYGGFLKCAIIDSNYSVIPYSDELPLSEFVYHQMVNLSKSDSITIDPHKQGLISYGAGAVLYQNEELRSIILNTAPYTYHQLDKPNIGMFSLEGSRPGAMAAACYLTYKVLPLNNSGVGDAGLKSLTTSKEFYNKIKLTDSYSNLHEPDLDINCFYVKSPDNDVTVHNELVLKVYKQLSVEAENPEFILSKFVMNAELAGRILPNLKNDKKENVVALRSVFMKHWNSDKESYYVNKLVESLEEKIQN
jgi:glutamate/tyrosine decarboxylase-like PLP-dependent enzyme